MKYEGSVAIGAIRKMRVRPSAILKRDITVPEQLDALLSVTVLQHLQNRPGVEGEESQIKATVLVALAHRNQRYRVTGFDDMAKVISDLNPGDVFEAFGRVVYARQNQGYNGFIVEPNSLMVTKKADEETIKTISAQFPTGDYSSGEEADLEHDMSNEVSA